MTADTLALRNRFDMKFLFFIACFVFVACKKPVEEPTIPVPIPLTDQGIFEKLGHRGCRAYRPENTISAMIKGVEMGVTNLEMDLAITKDNKVIVTHDPFFSHLISTKPNGQYVTEEEESSLNMYQMNYDQVKTYDVGMHPVWFSEQLKIPAVVPMLSDLIDSVELYCKQKGVSPVTYNVEIKSNPFLDGIYYPQVKDYVELVMAVAISKNVLPRFNISSFDTRALQYIHQKYPAVITCLNSNNIANIETDISNLGYYPKYYSTDYSTITPALVEKAHKLGVKVIAFTVNTKASIQALQSIGVNGAVSDYPDLF